MVILAVFPITVPAELVQVTLAPPEAFKVTDSPAQIGLGTASTVTTGVGSTTTSAESVPKQPGVLKSSTSTLMV